MSAEAQKHNDEKTSQLKAALKKTPHRVGFGGGFHHPAVDDTKKLNLAGSHDHLLNTIITPIQMRCGYNAETDCVWSEENRLMAPPLEKVVSVYKDALKNCETSDGYLSLCNHPSERLYKEHLLPEFEGFARNIEPDPIIQVEDDLDDLMASAEKAQALLKQTVLGGTAKDWKEGTKTSHPEGVPIALFAQDNGLKSRESARSKARVRQGPSEGSPGCYKHLLDLSRLLLVFSSCDLLQSGLDQIQRRFEVVAVRNYFQRPPRCGARYVEMHVVVQIQNHEGDTIPHVCELRLEEICFHKAQELVEPHVREFIAAFHKIYDRANRDKESLEGYVRTTLARPPVPHDVRVFKCHFAKRYGSTISGWRKEFSGQKLLQFSKFRGICQKMQIGERAAEYWQGLDPGLGGTISIFDFDPEAVSTLIAVRSRLIALADHGHVGETAFCPKGNPKVDPEAIFNRLCFLVRPQSPGKLERQEFRAVMKPMGLNIAESDKVFHYLDVHHLPPATISVTDIAWLMGLTNLVDIQDVMLTSDHAQSTSEALRQIAWSRGTARHNKRGQILQWSVFKETRDFAKGRKVTVDGEGGDDPARNSLLAACKSGTPIPPSEKHNRASLEPVPQEEDDVASNSDSRGLEHDPQADFLDEDGGDGPNEELDEEDVPTQLPIDSGYAPRTSDRLKMEAVDDGGAEGVDGVVDEQVEEDDDAEGDFMEDEDGEGAEETF
jgi:hypothetical protein